MEETVVELILNATTAAKTSLKSSAAKIEGSVGSTDNCLVKSDGTGTFTVQATGITVDDSNRVGIGRAPTTHMMEITSQDNSADTGLQIFANNETQSMTLGWSEITTTFSKVQLKSTNAGLELLRTDNSVLIGATDGVLTVGNTTVSGSDGRVIVAKNNGSGGTRSASMRFDASFNFGYFDQDATFIFGASYLAPANSFVIASSGLATFGASVDVNGNIAATGFVGNNSVGGVLQSGALSGVFTSETTGGRFNALVHGYNDVVFSTGNGSYTYRQSAVFSGADHSLSLVGDLICATAGKGIELQSGTGARAGNATLVAGTVTVTNTTVTANTLILVSRKTAGGTLGNLTYTLSAGASFTINSSSGTDTSVVSYVLIEVN